MADPHDDLRRLTAEAVRMARREMAAEFGDDPLHGFALCTDSDVMTLYAAACTKAWVAARADGDEGIGSGYTDWEQNAGGRHFGPASHAVAALAEDEVRSTLEQREVRSTVEQRFEALVLALHDCRNEGIFDPDTLLCCGSTDPSDEMERLAMEAVDRLNTPATADAFAKDLGYEAYRKKGG